MTASDARLPQTEECRVSPYFDQALVVSVDRHNKPMSRYGDTSWNISAQSSDQTSGVNLYFFEAPAEVMASANNLELATQIREQQKALMWLHMDAGKVRSQGTIKLSNHALTTWSERAYARGINLFDLLSDPIAVGEEAITLNATYAELSRTLIKTLWRNRRDIGMRSEFRLREIRSAITSGYSTRDNPNHQTPIIPSKVYCKILGNLIGSLDVLEHDIPVLLDAYQQSIAASRAVPRGSNEMRIRKIRTNRLRAVADCMGAYGYTRQSALDKFISSQINYRQSILMHLVIAFTGMRVGEASILPLANVLESFEDHRGAHYIVKGYTTKLNGGTKKATSWITSREGHRAIILAQRISSTIFREVKGGAPSTDDPHALLFCSIKNPHKKKSQQILYQSQARLTKEMSPVVDQEDINELNELELDRSWQREGIETGKPWPLAFHQLRRSLSVYAHRSGMVSLPALKAQLQHITDEMRAYYSDGFSRAVNLVFDPDHFSHEWNAAKAESSYMGYALGLLFSDEELLGHGASRMSQTISSRPRKETIQLFQQGKIAYRETVLGGCTSTEECKSSPMEAIPIDCLESNCINLVVHRKRLDFLIQTQEGVAAALEESSPGSVEHRLEANHLKVLISAREKLQEGKST